MTQRPTDIGDEQRLKAKLARVRRRRSIEEPIWQAAQRDPSFPAALAGDPSAERQISRVLSTEFFLTRKQRRANEARQLRKEPSLIPPKELRRAEVQARHLARLARRLGESTSRDDATGEKLVVKPRVQAFRDDFLGGCAGSSKVAWEMLKSPAVGLLHADYFRKRYKVLRHRAVVLGRETRIDPKFGRVDHYKIEVDSVGEGKRVESTSIYERGVVNRLWFRLDGEPRSLLVAPGSVLDELRVLSESLASHFGWEVAESTTFVLTDAVPATPCVRIEPKQVFKLDHTYSRLTMTIQPWVSTKTVARIYKAWQRGQLNLAQGVVSDSPQIHATSIRSLDLFDFAAERLDTGMSWREVMKAWNKARPRVDRYPKDGERNFSRDVRLIHDRVVYLQRQPRAARDKRSQSGQS